MTTDDLAGVILGIVAVASFALTWYGDREHKRLLKQADRRAHEEHQARINTIGYGQPQIVRRSPRPLTENDIVNRAAEKGGAPKGTSTKNST